MQSASEIRNFHSHVVDIYFQMMTSHSRMAIFNLTHRLPHLIIVNRGNGLKARQTSKEQTKTPRFMLEGPRPCTIFCFAFIHYA